MSGTCGRHRARGTVLVEVVLVTVLVGVVASLAVGGVAAVTDRRLAGAARVLLADLRWASHQAGAARTCVRVTFDPVRDTYTLARYVGPVAVGAPHCTGGQWTGPLLADAPDGAVSRRMPRGVDLLATTFPAQTLTFSPLGNPPAGTVVLRAVLGRERRITVEVTGLVRLSRG